MWAKTRCIARFPCDSTAFLLLFMPVRCRFVRLLTQKVLDETSRVILFLWKFVIIGCCWSMFYVVSFQEHIMLLKAMTAIKVSAIRDQVSWRTVFIIVLISLYYNIILYNSNRYIWKGWTTLNLIISRPH